MHEATSCRAVADFRKLLNHQQGERGQRSTKIHTIPAAGQPVEPKQAHPITDRALDKTEYAHMPQLLAHLTAKLQVGKRLRDQYRMPYTCKTRKQAYCLFRDCKHQLLQSKKPTRRIYTEDFACPMETGELTPKHTKASHLFFTNARSKKDKETTTKNEDFKHL